MTHPRGTSPIDAEGGCACGAIRYRVRGVPREEAICHCTDCRRACGAPMVAWATFDTDAVEWKTRPKIRRSSKRALRGFCPECGTQLSFHNDSKPHEIDLTLASLDDPEVVSPKFHLFVRSKISWVSLADGWPQHETWSTPRDD